MRRPQILILDDSYSALDYLTERRLSEEIAKLSYAPLILLVSQRITSISHADLILVLDGGKLAGAGTHEQLLKDCSIYRELALSQEITQ